MHQVLCTGQVMESPQNDLSIPRGGFQFSWRLSLQQFTRKSSAKLLISEGNNWALLSSRNVLSNFCTASALGSGPAEAGHSLTHRTLPNSLWKHRQKTKGSEGERKGQRGSDGHEGRERERGREWESGLHVEKGSEEEWVFAIPGLVTECGHSTVSALSASSLKLTLVLGRASFWRPVRMAC